MYMKKSKTGSDFLNPRKWRKPFYLLFAATALYLLFLAAALTRNANPDADAGESPPFVDSIPDPKLVKPHISYGRITGELLRRRSRRFTWSGNLSMLETAANNAWSLGAKAWREIENNDFQEIGREERSCPSSVSENFENKSVEMEEMVVLPCGLEVGSSITVIGKPERGRREYVPEMVKRGRMGGGDGWVLVSQFMVELQGVKGEESEEDAAKVLHFNPRLKGDWSGRPVIEMNTCYRMQWGASMRCDGMVAGGDEEEKVDGFNKCKKWVQSDNGSSKEAKTTSWLKRFIGRAKKPEIAWPFPFTEGKLFVLTLQAGIEGYHIYVGGLHVTSFPYRPGFTLDDATSLVIKGNVDVHSVYATSLPKSHPSYSIQKVLEMSDKWKSPPLPKGHVYLFIGILSATNHFAERMAVRKSWMQYPDIKSSYVVTRFFVALGSIKEVNVMMKKEAEYFGDIVILPFMDHYELVVLKSIAMCEYGINNITASYIMKCDDDTFIRLDVVLRVLKRFASRKSLYMGNLNLFHRPLRTGKWAVTYEEWPEDIYPPYANGPGYIISNDIASFIASKHANHSLKMFKMEDVSMGMWVEEFNASSSPVKYLHSWKFCQYGCIENYYTAHYQSPRQMICLWDKLSRGQAQCCNRR